MSSIQPISSSGTPTGPRIPLSACFLPDLVLLNDWLGVSEEQCGDDCDEATMNVNIVACSLREQQISQGILDIDTNVADRSKMTSEQAHVSNFTGLLDKHLEGRDFRRIQHGQMATLSPADIPMITATVRALKLCQDSQPSRAALQQWTEELIDGAETEQERDELSAFDERLSDQTLQINELLSTAPVQVTEYWNDGSTHLGFIAEDFETIIDKLQGSAVATNRTYSKEQIRAARHTRSRAASRQSLLTSRGQSQLRNPAGEIRVPALERARNRRNRKKNYRQSNLSAATLSEATDAGGISLSVSQADHDDMDTS